MKKSPSLIGRIMTFSKKYTPYLILIVIFSLIGVFSGLYSTILIGEGIDCIAGKGKVDFYSLYIVLSKFIAVTIVIFFSEWMLAYCNGKLAYGTIKDMRVAAIKKFSVAPLKFIDEVPHGEIMDNVIADAEIISDGLLLGFTQLFSGIVTILATLGFMFYYNYKIALIVVLATPLSLFTASFIAKSIFNLFKKQSKTRGKLTSFIEEYIGGYSVVKSFGSEEKVCAEFDKINTKFKSETTKALFMSSTINPSTRFINNLVYAAVAIFGAFQIIVTKSAANPFTVGRLTSFLMYANKYTKPFNEISGVMAEFQNALNSAERIFKIIDMEPQTPDIANAITLENVKGNVEIEDIYFSYTQENKLIENFNLSVKSGQKVAIVGKTGCGKTTLINLLMRYYDVDKGEIRIEDIPIKNIKRDSLRKSFGMVLQDTWLKKGTVFENISYGKTDSSLNEVISASENARAHSFIEKLPEGYNTVISDDATNISQGQKQLLCIARAMLTRPPMLILDEATSSIDSLTEIQIQKAFAKLMEGRTSFIIAHRLSTIKEADLIIVMDSGKIIEQGDHESLLKNKGYYYFLYHSQFDNTDKKI